MKKSNPKDFCTILKDRSIIINWIFSLWEYMGTKKKKQTNHNTNNSQQVTREQRRKGRKRTYKTESKIMNKMAIRTYMSIITLNGNRLNAPTKRQTDWIQKQDLYICCLRNLL